MSSESPNEGVRWLSSPLNGCVKTCLRNTGNKPINYLAYYTLQGAYLGALTDVHHLDAIGQPRARPIGEDAVGDTKFHLATVYLGIAAIFARQADVVYWPESGSEHEVEADRSA